MAVLKVKDGSSWHNIDSIKGDKGDTGTSIVSVTKTGSQGLIDIYTIAFSDGTSTTFEVKNGENGQGSGSVTSVDTGVGLTGGAITSSGTIKADLVSDTYSTEASEAITQTSGRQYAVNPDANGKLSVNVPWTDEGKTYTAGTNVQISSSNVISATDTTYESKTAASGGTAVSLVTTGEKYTWNQAEPNVQSDWNATSGDAKILNKPTNVSAFTNDAGYLTSFTETDPTVPSWAKASSKPTYTASEVGALPDTTSIPSKTSDLTNDAGYITGYTETDPVFSASAASGISSSDITSWDGKQDALVTGTNLKKVSRKSLLMSSPSDDIDVLYMGVNPTNGTDTAQAWEALGNGWCYITSASETTGQPSNYGVLRNTVIDRNVVQEYLSLSDATVLGNIYVRGIYAPDGATTAMPAWRTAGGVAVVSVASFSSLPQSVTNASVTADMVCIKVELGTPSAQTGDWTVETWGGGLTISGSISGSTTATLYLARKEN